MIINKTNFDKLNTNQITTIKKFLKSVHGGYEWRKKFFFRKEGFYYIYTILPYIMTKEEIEDDGILYCEDNKVYHKPFIRIKMSDQHEYELYFETVNKLDSFLNKENLNTSNWL